MNKKIIFREAIKIALATVIAYYIGMKMEWMNPTWAAISVGMISLPTAGQSINKGILRMGGTLMAFVAGLFFLGLYPQSRWLFFLSLTPFLAIVAYKTAGKKNQYFWFVMGFVTLMICTAGSGTSEYVFQFATFRTLETLMGIAVWTLISVFIWPRSNLKTLKMVSENIFTSKTKVIKEVSTSLLSTNFDDHSGINSLLTSIKKLEDQLEQTIMGAASESYEVSHLRGVWEHFHIASMSIYEVLDKLNSTSNDLKAVNLKKVIPNLGSYLAFIESRFEKSAKLLDGTSKEPLSEDKQALKLTIDKNYTNSKDSYQNMVIASLIKELIHLNSLSLKTLNFSYRITGVEEEDDLPKTHNFERYEVSGLLRFLSLDPDQVRASVMVVISMWLGAFIWIYINPPGHISWFQFLPNVTLVIVMTPWIKFAMFKPFLYAYILGLFAYVFIMPHLTMFWQLGLIIMAFSFAAAYVFTNSAMRMALYLSMYNMLGIQNDQTYDFASQINTMTFTLMAFLVCVGLTYILKTPRPEKMFLSMVHRFFVAGNFINDRSPHTSAKTSFLNKLKTAFYMQELRTLPGKMALWGSQINPLNFPNNSSVQITAIVTDLNLLTLRIEDLYIARQKPLSQNIPNKLNVDFLQWYDGVNKGFKKWSTPLTTIQVEQHKKEVIKDADNLANDIKTISMKEYSKNINKNEKENLYELVTCMSGLSNAAHVFSSTFEKIDWVEWNKEVFS